jgi:hypothetical protein
MRIFKRDNTLINGAIAMTKTLIAASALTLLWAAAVHAEHDTRIKSLCPNPEARCKVRDNPEFYRQILEHDTRVGFASSSGKVEKNLPQSMQGSWCFDKQDDNGVEIYHRCKPANQQDNNDRTIKGRTFISPVGDFGCTLKSIRHALGDTLYFVSGTCLDDGRPLKMDSWRFLIDEHGKLTIDTASIEDIQQRLVAPGEEGSRP